MFSFIFGRKANVSHIPHGAATTSAAAAAPEAAQEATAKKGKAETARYEQEVISNYLRKKQEQSQVQQVNKLERRLSAGRFYVPYVYSLC